MVIRANFPWPVLDPVAITLDNPSDSRRLASRRLQSSHPTPPTYANVTAPHQHASSSPSSQPSPSSSATSLKPTETTRHNRTQILRRLPYNTTTQQLITDLTRQLGYAEDALFERVLRDPNDSRRFYLTYRTDELKRYATGKGFYVKHLHIKPTDGATHGYIPFPPYYIDESTLQDLLRPYGTLVTGDFVKTKLNTRIAGYKFSINIHKDATPPVSLVYNGCRMEIKYDDDLRQCKYCGRYGHLIGKCRTKARDDETNKERRDAIRTAAWQEDRQKLTDERDREREKLEEHFDNETVAVSDVHEAALIAIEGNDDFTERRHHLVAVYREELAEMQGQFMDSLSFLDNEISTRKEKLDAQYQRAGGIIPPGVQTPDDSFCSEAEPDQMDEDDAHEEIARAESRLTARLLEHCSPEDTQPPPVLAAAVTDTALTTPPVAETAPAPPSETQPPPHQPTPKPTKTPKTATPFYTLPKSAQDKLVRIATQDLPSDFNYKTHSKYQIQLKTDTPHITQILRAHLFDLRRRRGYQYVNPMETVVCTSDADDTQRIIYIRDTDMAAHLTSFLNQCREKQLINFLEDPVQGMNPSYDKNTGWE